MRNLLNFIVRYSKWFVFTLYVLISLILLVSGSSYPRSVYLTSANVVTGSVFKGWSQMTGYFHLRDINESLQASNAALQNEVLNLQNEIARYRTLIPDSMAKDLELQPDRFGYISAAVVNNNTRHPKNYFTIDRGSLDGIRTGMGVVDQSGVVGIVNVIGNHISRVISVLNESQLFSVKVKGTTFIGTLMWKGGDPSVAYVEEIPRHAAYNIGDTIVTSGNSTAFPEGLPIGVILNKVRGRDDSFITLKVKLTSDFKALSTVRVITDIYKSEIDSLANIPVDKTPVDRKKTAKSANTSTSVSHDTTSGV